MSSWRQCALLNLCCVRTQSEMQIPALEAALEVPLAATEICRISPQQGELQDGQETCGGQLPISHVADATICRALPSTLKHALNSISHSPATKEQAIA